MDLQHIKASVQPELDQDFDALYEDYVADTGSEDLSSFLQHILEFGLVPEEVVRPLLDALKAETSPEPTEQPVVPPIVWDDGDGDDEEEATVLASADALISMSKAAANSLPPSTANLPDARGSDTPAPPSPKPEPPSPKPEPSRPEPETQAPAAGASEPEKPVSSREEPPEPRYESASPVTYSPPRLSRLPDFRKDSTDAYTDRKRTQFRRRNGQLEETGAFRRPQQRQRRRNPVSTERDTTHYDFVGQVGEGAMGTVLLVKDRQLHRTIAYKEMSAEIAAQPALASKFLAEAQITAQLEHPNIVPVYALEGKGAYTMKLIRGRTVEDLINETREQLEKNGQTDEDHTLEARLDLFLKVCDALAFSHARGVLHRDLKPENIMLGEFGEVYVMDWGIAHLLNGDYEEQPHVEGLLDEGDLIIGTAGYMSPEQADGRTEDLTGASDQYALGLILHELIGLKPAVTGKNPVHIMTRHQLGEVNPLVHFKREPLPPELVAIVQKATAFDPKDRYPSVDHLADDIRRYLRGEAVEARPDNPWQALVRFTGRHRQATLLAGVSAIFGSLLLVLSVGIYAQVSTSRAAAREQALSKLATVAGRHAAAIEGKLVRFEGLLSILATTSEDMLTMGDPSPRGVYTPEDFDAGTPPGMVDSSLYGIPISLQTAAFHLPASAPPTARRTLLKLEPMNRHYRKVMLRSQSEEAASYTPRRAIRALAEVGVPLRWTYIATEDGGYSVFPGHGSFPRDFDPRTTTWYRRAASANGPVWTPPMRDEDLPDGGWVVPCTISLRGDDGELLGVAGIDVRFDYLADDLLVPESVRDTSAAVFLVGQDGTIILDPHRQSTGQPYPDSAIQDAIQARRSGFLEKDDAIVIYTRMPSLDWYYVVSGPTEELLDTVR